MFQLLYDMFVFSLWFELIYGKLLFLRNVNTWEAEMLNRALFYG